MQSDKFDKKAREAAEHHHPAYDEQAWERMEKLLDKHLPQEEKKKRRFIFILFMFLFLGGSAWLLSTKPWEKDESPVAGIERPANPDNRETTVPGSKVPVPSRQEQQLPGNPSEPDNLQQAITGSKDHIPTNRVDDVQNPGIQTAPQKAGDGQTLEKIRDSDPGKASNSRDRSGIEITSRVGKSRKNNSSPGKDDVNQPVQDKKTATVKNTDQVPGMDNPTLNPDVSKQAKTGEGIDKPAGEKPGTKVEPASTVKRDSLTQHIVKASEESVTKTESPVAPAEPKSKTRKGQPRKNTLSFTLSTGPDISFVGDNKPGRTQLVAGLGLEYSIKDRFSIRSGFYSARKIYTAKPSDYKAPPEFYQAYPYLEKVDANCRVYEIPLSVSYLFEKKPTGKWFVSAGVSSFLMNEETYNYFYKYTPTGNTFSNEWTIRNENYHMFSVGTLSAGYKRNIGKRVSLTAEPYVKVPFSGVGYGKVKLNSGGVLFTMGVKLF